MKGVWQADPRSEERGRDVLEEAERGDSPVGLGRHRGAVEL